MNFRSAVDWWFYAVLIVTVAVVLPAAASIVGRVSALELVLSIGTFVLALGLPVWLLCSTVYRVDADAIHVRSGPFRWTIPLSEIHAVRASRSPLSSPALSLDRIEIRYGRNKRILLSPADKEGFLRAIGRKLEAA